jgi:peptidoglycan hydrolase FlgJ
MKISEAIGKMEDLGIVSKQTIAPDSVVQPEIDNRTGEKKERDKRLKKACADFESLFIYYMLKKMRATVPKSGLMKEMQGKDTYEAITDQKVSENLADRGGVGLQKMLFNQIKNGI